ncbi:pentatricopeptide repeat-containing protein [Pyrus ussuriensis x Pyrus communis]|uniref:Pentatricopeptide repeat-containing protein n=1 Tax=Pyrus ussuriensis x Pyrus communis TaxID=2448454 RepID=A0A5N5FSW9_9ROSA|nr:pentatricopeptide repeat-containing protein [Pyrus ussuriensis x Pyrus communis]
MLEKGLGLNVATYNALINGYREDGAVEAAREILALMESNACCPDVYTLSALIDGLCKRNNVHQAMALRNKMLELKLSPNLVTYNSLIHGQCKADHFDSACRLRNLITHSGLAPDQITYCAFIDSLCKWNRLPEAQTMFDTLKKNGIKSSTEMFTALIDGYCKIWKIDAALSLFDQMLTEDCLPNSYAINALIHGLFKERKMMETSSVIEKMLSIGVKPTVPHYNILINRVLKEGEFDRAHELLNKMVSVYCALGNIKEAEKVMIKMNVEGISADSLTYRFLIDAYVRMGLIECAFDVLKRMFGSGCEPCHRTYSFLNKHLSNEKLVMTNSKAVGLDIMLNVSGNITDIWKTKDFGIVLELFEKMVGHGCAPSMNTYGELIIRHCKERNLQVAQRLYNHMRDMGISPNEGIYNSLVNCCCEMQVYGEAAMLVHTMIEHGYLPALESCKLLVCGLFDEEDDEKAKAVFCSMLRCGYNYDEVAWKLLLDGLVKRGHLNRGSELLTIMETMGCQLYPETNRMLTEGLNGT